jgi:hypothetical protein
MKKYLLFAVIALASIGLASCLDEDPPFVDDGNPGIVELDLSARTSATPFAFRNVPRGDAAVVDVSAIVNYTGVHGTPADVQVTLDIDNEAVVTYATSQRVTLPVVPSYELPASTTVTIPKGQKYATFTVKVPTAGLDSKITYGIGIKIVSSTGGTISGNYSTGVYRLTP